MPTSPRPDDCATHCALASHTLALDHSTVTLAGPATPSALEPTLTALDRRTFLSQATLAAAVTLLAACGLDDFPTSPATVNATIEVGDYPALAAVGGIATLSANGTPIAIVRSAASTFVALSRICPHRGRTINASAPGFLCPGHKARFDSQGTWTGGQRTSNMRAYATTYDEARGTLTIG